MTPAPKPAAARLHRRGVLQLGDFPADAAWSADGRTLLVAGGQGQLILVDAGAPPALEVLGEHAGGVLAVAWQSAGRLFASSGQDGEVRLWDFRTRECRCIHAAPEWSERLSFASHGRLLAVGTGRTLQVFASDGALQATWGAHWGVIAAVAWRPKSSEIAAVGNGGARVHRVQPVPQSQEYPWTGACLTASWSPDGRLLASGQQDGAVHYWNVVAGTQSQMKGYGTKVTLTSWSGNGRHLATSSDQQIVVWDFSGRGPEGTEPLQLSAHTARLTQMSFQPQGALLVSGARDRRLALWHPAHSSSPIDADLLGDEIAMLRWSNDGTQLAAADRSGALSLYTLSGSN